MPQLGETVAEGTVTRWLKKVGDLVADQEPLLEISTDKVDTEVPSPAAGTLLEIVVGEDSTVSVGAVLAVIGSAGAATGGGGTPAAAEADDAPSAPGSPPSPAPAPEQPAARTSGPAVADRVEGAPRHVHSPRVRRLAREHGIALDAVAGTGPHGRVTPVDVERAAAAAPGMAAAPAPGPAAAPARPATPSVPLGAGDRREPMSRLRSVVAERMMTSLHTSAQLTSVVEVDVTRVVELRREVAADLRDRLGVRLTLTAFFAKAAVEALRAHPVLNSSIEPDGATVVTRAGVHLGVAVDTDKGLMVPVVRDAQDLNVLGLSRRIEDVAARTRGGTIGPDELAGGTFTLTNTGSRGALWDTPILVPGQVGILGTGAVVERPVVVRRPDGERVIAIRSMAHLALTYDHRLVDGADAARFLTTIKERLEAGRFETEIA
ncbi:MAG: 2-oxoglutarate dehydrogenase, E2 component, dihydrolipoamide succinyltransferase [Frankiales bacterium]|nr:2-oxoglutarate dehydrogenase, E2 component, dihydrolipoamide succinyltransferase [Frankiales bacterium]